MWNRRKFISVSAIGGAASAIVKGPVLNAHRISHEVPWQPGQADAPAPIDAGGYQFLTAAEVVFIDAAVDRLIPADEFGPGAKAAGVTTFIDRQLAGTYGAATNWYMQGPWRDGDDTQGFQSRLTPAQLYRAAIKAIDAHSRKSLASPSFASMSIAQQDTVLSGLERGDIQLDGVAAKTFFELLLQNTIEGFFCDPVYGGNRDMIGWKLLGFPGARYDYRPYVAQHGQKLDLPPVSLKGRPGWST